MRTQFHHPALTLCVLTTLAGSAHGFGLNKIYGNPIIGKPFHGEIPIQSAPTVSDSCIRLRAVDGDNEFFISDLKVNVTGPANARRIIITSQSPVRNPMVQFLVDVQCGDAAMMREYLQLADNAAPEQVPLQDDIALPVVTEPMPTPLPASAASAAPANTGNVVPRSPGSGGARPKSPAANKLTTGSSGSSGSTSSTGNTPTTVAPAGPPRVAARAKGGGKKTDQLMVGAPNPQLQMLADAIVRLEASAAERDKINAELVGGVSSALNSIIELKERIKAQDEQVKQLIALQIESERRRAREKEEELGTLGLLGLLLAAMAAGAGLIALLHTHAGRRQARNEASAGAVLEWHDLSADTSDDLTGEHDVWAQATDKAMPVTAGVAPAPMPEVAPAASPAPVVSTPATVPQSAPEKADQDKEPDGLLDQFGEQMAGVTATINRLRATGSRDPEEWLGLVRQARVAGLMTSADMQRAIGEFKRLFNVSLDQESSDIGLEAFPHVARQVQNAWGHHEGLSVLNSLLFDDREGRRSGFTEGCFEELVMLREVLAVRVAMFGEDSVLAVPTSPGAESDMIEFKLPFPPAGPA